MTTRNLKRGRGRKRPSGGTVRPVLGCEAIDRKEGSLKSVHEEIHSVEISSARRMGDAELLGGSFGVSYSDS